MPTSKVAAIEKTLQKTNEWLVRIMQGLGTAEPEQAYAVLRATLHSLRDALPPEEATAIGSQLPLMMRGIYYEGWRASPGAPQEAPADRFLRRVTEELGRTAAEARLDVVLQVLSREIASDGIDVQRILPESLRASWRK